MGKISAQPHRTLCIQFLNRENNDKNTTLPFGKQICFTIVRGCAETLPFNVFYLRNTKNLSTLKLQIIREITNGNFRNCTHPTFMGNYEANGCKWPSRYCFLSMRKARWIPPLKHLEKLKQFRGLCKNRILLVRFIIFQTLLPPLCSKTGDAANA